MQLPVFPPRSVRYIEAMNDQTIHELSRALLAGELPTETFLRRISAAGIADTGDAQVDLDRRRRCGFPEVVFGQGKTPEAIERIFRKSIEYGADGFATRISQEQAEHLTAAFPDGRYNRVARTFHVMPPDTEGAFGPGGRATLVTAGTSDLPVAEEARETLLWTGTEVRMLQDVGVAGPHRLRAHLDQLEGADAVVVVAGMEGALPSVVGGFVDCPVIAVPTSVGYGASFGGLAALLGMLNSCASNVTVVNIDAGFKGGYVAGLIARNAALARKAAGKNQAR